MATECSCGHPADSKDPHPCHGKGHTCGKPATQRFYAQSLGTYSLAGAQMKLAANRTFACDECWAAFQEILNRGTL